MPMRIATVATTAVALAATGLGPVGQLATADEPPPPPVCDVTDRQCKIDTAFTYLDALVTHDSASVRLAPDAWRMNNGRVSAQGEDELRAVIEVEPVAGHGAFQWIVEGDDAIAIYELDSDLTRAAQSEAFAPEETWVPAYIAERFRVEDGEACGPNPAPCITEIEVVYWGDPTFGPRPERPLRPDSHPGGTCTDGSRECAIEVAGAYLDALASHNASQVPLAPDAWRLENGGNTGDSGEEIRAGVESPIMDVIVALDGVRWWVEDDQAVAFYTLWADGTGLLGEPAGPEGTLTPAYVVERFRIQDGLIKEIEAIFWIDPPGSRPDARPA